MFKIIRNNEVLEIQEKLDWVKYQRKNDIFISTTVNDGEGVLVGKEVEMPIDPEDENSPTEMVYQPKAEIYIVEGRNNPKGLEEVIIKEITEEDEKRDADIDYLSIMTGVDLNV